MRKSLLGGPQNPRLNNVEPNCNFAPQSHPDEMLCRKESLHYAQSMWQGMAEMFCRSSWVLRRCMASEWMISCDETR